MTLQKPDGVLDSRKAADILSSFRRCSDRRYRDAHGLVAVEGVRFVVRAHQAGLAVRAVLSSRRLLRSRAGREVLADLRERGVPEVRITPERFRQLSSAKRASGIAALVEQPRMPMASAARAAGLWLGIRRIDAPGNLGTILRSVEAAGAPGLVLLGSVVDLFDPAVVRASIGAVFDVATVRSSHRRLQRAKADLGLHILAADAHEGRVYDGVDLTKPTLLLLGHERSGLTDEEMRLADDLVKIPMQGRQSSLNVASAASVFLFESLRQRKRAATRSPA